MVRMDKCSICGKETRKDCYAKLDNEIIQFCSPQCAFNFMIQKCREGKIIAIRIPEGWEFD
jgi:ribosomal protein L24E